MNLIEGSIDRIKSESIRFVSGSKPFESNKKKALRQSVKPDRSAVNRNPNLYIESKILRPGHIILAGGDEIKIDRDTVMVFSDDEPLLNWSHNCRYLLYDVKTEKLYREVSALFPPRLVDPSTTFTAFHEPTKHTESNADEADEKLSAMNFRRDINLKPEEPAEYNPRFPNYPGERYALLYSGCTNKPHFYDLETIYRTLIFSYGFKPDNIYVLNYNGSKNYSAFHYEEHRYYPAHKDRALYLNVNGKGTRTDLDAAIDELKERLKEDDLLFIHTNNHGDGPSDNSKKSESSLMLYSEEGITTRYYAGDFASKLAELSKFSELMVMMEQCYSGGFCDPIIKNSPAYETSVTTACTGVETSRSGFTFNPFTWGWINVMSGKTYMPAEDDRPPSAYESFLKAGKYSTKDNPVIKSNPANCHKRMCLGYKIKS